MGIIDPNFHDVAKELYEKDPELVEALIQIFKDIVNEIKQGETEDES